jgi:hypothetical protein
MEIPRASYILDWTLEDGSKQPGLRTRKVVWLLEEQAIGYVGNSMDAPWQATVSGDQ